ncbi:MAG: YfhO family protein, partial [Deltaproteobacteria bacterium]|nr:YfhO family protein [Deltaproteobacteria bacterium]
LLLHYFLAGLFMYLFLRAQLLTRTGSLLGAIYFMFSGFLIAHINHLGIVEGAVWLPLFLLFFQKALLTGRFAYLCWTGITLALIFFTGHPQVTFMVSIMGGAYALFHFLLVETEHRKAWKKVAGISLGIAGLAAGLTAIQWVPTYELAHFIGRTKVSLNYLTEYSLPPSTQLLSLFNPGWGIVKGTDEFYGYMGILPIFMFILSAHLRPWRKILFYQLLALGSILLVIANGLPPFLCRIYANIPGFNVFRISSRFLLLFNFSLAVLVGFVLDWIREKNKSPAKVKIHPFFWLLWMGLVAGLVLFNSGSVHWTILSGSLKSVLGSRPFILTLIAMAVLALVGATLKQWLKPSIFLLLIFILALTELFYSNRHLGWKQGFPEKYYQPNERVLFLQKMNSPDYRLRNEGGLYCRGFIDEASMGNRFRIYTTDIGSSLNLLGINAENRPSLRLVVDESESNPQLLDLLNIRFIATTTDLTLGPNGKYAGFILGPGKDKVISLDGLYDHPVTRISLISLMTFGLEIPQGETVAELTVMDQYGKQITFPIRAGMETSEWSWEKKENRTRRRHGQATIESSWGIPQEGYQGHSYRSSFKFNSPIIPKTIIISRVNHRGNFEVRNIFLDGTDLFSLGKRFTKVFGQVYENRFTLPKAFLVRKGLPAHKDRILYDLMALDPLDEVIVGPGAPLFQPPLERSSKIDFNRVQVTSYGANRITLNVLSQTRAYLVLSEVYYPGWKAYVDGREKTIFPADYAFRGIPIDPGEHKVAFRYQPISIKIGGIISLLTLSFIFLVSVGWRRKKDKN